MGSYFLLLYAMKETIKRLYEIYKKHPLITTDSRSVIHGSIFFAIKGDNFNGNEFAIQALNNGAVLAVVDQDLPGKENRLFRVEDVLKTLQDLANYHRQVLGIKLLAITGTNGKTTTKELIQKVLQKKFKSLATKGNLNNHIGVPLTILSLTAEHDFAIIEMGANHQGEIAALCEIAMPDFGIITNVGKAHLEGFGSFEGVVKTKTELYSYIKKGNGTLFLNQDNNILKNAAAGMNCFTYGTNSADCIGKITGKNPYLEIECDIHNQTLLVQSKLIGSYNFENIMAAICIGNYFKVPLKEIKEAIESYEPSNNRSQISVTINNTLILDAYNANPSSMKAAIENFAESDFKNKSLILGDMAELGSESKKEHAALIELLTNPSFKNVFLVGDNFHEVNNKGFKSFSSIEDFIIYLKLYPIKDCTILLKASRKMQLERIISFL
jgi:UDP-N-acetylmuramoyl-tripeptide--D-alanyl-D-alanine ligase